MLVAASIQILFGSGRWESLVRCGRLGVQGAAKSIKNVQATYYTNAITSLKQHS